MSKKKLKKLTGKEDSLDGRDDENIEDIRSYSRTMKGETEFQRFKTEKDGQEEKQDRSSNSSHSTDGKSRGKSSNRNKTTGSSLIQTEKQKKVVIEFKAREIKHGKSTHTPDVVTTNKKSYNKSRLDETEGKRLSSFAVQRSKALKKKTEKAELCKLKLKGEQTMLEKIRSSVHGSHVPCKKADGKKLSEDVRNSKKCSAASARTVHDNRSFTKRPNILYSTWEEEYEGECKEFSKKKQHVSKHTPSRYSTEVLQQQDSCKQKKQDANSGKDASNTEKEKRDFKATSLRFKQRTDRRSTSIPTCFSNFEVPCTSDTYQEGEDTKSIQKSSEVFPPLQDSQIAETDQEMQIVEDLHVARVQKRMMLPVVETCGELTSMEIDLPEQDLNISAETFTSGLNILVVIDTNIMISHLEFVRSLKCENIPGVGRLALIIPWVVLQELDNLKKGKVLQHVRDKAIPAVQFIYMCLKNQDSKLWGQSMQLASQKICNICAINLFWVLNRCSSLSVNLSTKF